MIGDETHNNTALLELVKGPLAWLENWASHIGNCNGGCYCTCGLTMARYELETAKVALERSAEDAA